MTQLLSIEWMKVRRYRTFWIIVGMYSLLFILTIYLTSVGLFGPKSGTLLDLSATFETIWYDTCYYAGHFLIFISLMVAILFANEYQFRTNRQNVIDGWSRLQFIHAKWLSVLVLAIATTLFTALIGLVSGLIRGADFRFAGTGFYNIGLFFIEALNYYGFGLVLAVLLRRAGLTIIILTAYFFVADNLLHLYFVRNTDYGILAVDYFLPLEVSDQLFPMPSLSAAFEQASEMTGIKRLPRYTYGLATTVWIGVYYVISRVRLLKSDW